MATLAGVPGLLVALAPAVADAQIRGRVAHLVGDAGLVLGNVLALG